MNKDRILNALARAGYGARGFVYFVIGALATRAALTNSGSATDSKGAMLRVENWPAGEVLLLLLAVGLVGYSLWRLAQALFDSDDHGKDMKGIVIRAGLAVSAVTHLGLAYFAIKLVGASSSRGDGGADSLSAQLMQAPWGRWLVALVGLAIIGAGLAQGIKGLMAEYKKYMRFSDAIGRWADPLCRFGLMARAVVFLIIGFFLIYAAWTFDPDKAKGLGEALTTLQQQSYGTPIFAIVAIGLLSFGGYSVLEMIYRRVQPSLENSS